MKPMSRSLFTPLLSSIALITASPLPAQTTPALPPTPATRSDPTSPATTPAGADAASMSIRITGGTMAASIEEVQAALEAAKKPPINVLLGPGTQEIKVPNLTLRKVTGPDALKLIAASTGCMLEPIPGEHSEVIGYKVVAPAARRGDGAVADPAAASPVGLSGSLAPSPNLARSVEPTPHRNPKNPSADKAPTLELAPVAGMPGQPATDALLSFSSPAKSAPFVRVYGLGEITTAVKFNDVLQSVEEVLKASGVPPDSMKAAVHEKTNVLVVTGDARVHELIGQVIQALEKNTAREAAQQSRSEEARRQAIEADVRLNAEESQRKRLEEQLKSAESELSKVQRELDRVRSTTSPK